MNTATKSPALTVRGNQIVNADGQPVTLRGFGLGGWLNMENFITGYPGNEQAQREAIRSVLGDELYELFFDRFLEYFFAEDDVRFISSLGLNLVRLPINYRHFEDDMRPFEPKEEGFKHLERVIDTCARHGVYTIVDLHAFPGCQNQHWHSDNPTHVALFWEHKHFQDRAVWLWERFAERYNGNAWVAGYNISPGSARGASTSMTMTWCRLAPRPRTPIASCGRRRTSWRVRASSTAWPRATCSSSPSSRMARSRRNIAAGNRQVALIIDDLASVQPWSPRGIKVHGTAEIVQHEGQFGPGEYFAITPTLSWSWGIVADAFQSAPHRIEWRAA